ncbi:LysR family transcriptional regulator [Bdellovibrionota bacterium FG-1]
MELNYLRYFYEVAQAGSFTRASRVLRISQPSLSKAVQLLEAREGIQLFDRSKVGVTLTESGRAYYESCHLIFQEIVNLRVTASALKAGCAGELSLGASDNLCNYIFPQLFVQFWKKYPDVRVNLFNGTSESIKKEMIEGRAELGVFHTPVQDGAFEVTKLAFAEFSIVCSPKNRLLGKLELADPAVLEKAYFVGSRMTDYLKPYPAWVMLKSLRIVPKLFFETNSQETQKQMALQEYGYAVLPTFMVKQELASGRLKALKPSRCIGSDILLVKKRKRTLSRPVRVFEEFLRERVSGLIGQPRIG